MSALKDMTVRASRGPFRTTRHAPAIPSTSWASIPSPLSIGTILPADGRGGQRIPTPRNAYRAFTHNSTIFITAVLDLHHALTHFHHAARVSRRRVASRNLLREVQHDPQDVHDGNDFRSDVGDPAGGHGTEHVDDPLYRPGR